MIRVTQHLYTFVFFSTPCIWNMKIATHQDYEKITLKKRVFPHLILVNWKYYCTWGEQDNNIYMIAVNSYICKEKSFEPGVWQHTIRPPYRKKNTTGSVLGLFCTLSTEVSVIWFGSFNFFTKPSSFTLQESIIHTDGGLCFSKEGIHLFAPKSCFNRLISRVCPRVHAATWELVYIRNIFLYSSSALQSMN